MLLLLLLPLAGALRPPVVIINGLSATSLEMELHGAHNPAPCRNTTSPGWCGLHGYIISSLPRNLTWACMHTLAVGRHPLWPLPLPTLISTKLLTCAIDNLQVRCPLVYRVLC